MGEKAEMIDAVCDFCEGSGIDGEVNKTDACRVCNGTRVERYHLAPGSLTSARLRLADAAEAWAAKWLAPAACRDQDEWDAMLESAVKLAALRTARGA